MRGQLARAPSVSGDGGAAAPRPDLRLLLGVMDAPIHVASAADPLPHLSIKNTPIETSSAQYILQQYTAASGGMKLQRSNRNAYATGKVQMVATAAAASSGRWPLTSGTLSSLLVGVRFMLAAMAALYGATPPVSVPTLPKAPFAPSAALSRYENITDRMPTDAGEAAGCWA